MKELSSMGNVTYPTPYWAQPYKPVPSFDYKQGFQFYCFKVMESILFSK